MVELKSLFDAARVMAVCSGNRQTELGRLSGIKTLGGKCCGYLSILGGFCVEEVHMAAVTSMAP